MQRLAVLGRLVGALGRACTTGLRGKVVLHAIRAGELEDGRASRRKGAGTRGGGLYTAAGSGGGRRPSNHELLFDTTGTPCDILVRIGQRHRSESRQLADGGDPPTASCVSRSHIERVSSLLAPPLSTPRAR